MASMVRLQLVEVHAAATRALLTTQLLPASVEAIASTITDAERDGCKSHGLFRVPGYCKTVQLGKADAGAEPAVELAAPSVVQVDGARGFAPLALARGLPELAKAAKAQGVAVMAVRNVLHFASLWHEVEYLADRGLVGLACVSTKAYVAHGVGASSDRIYGTNPLAFAFPRAGQNHLIFDQASAAMARGEISLAGIAGELLPPGCAVDESGEPTLDPATALRGAQLTFGGIKGSNIALMVELLAAGLTASPLAYQAAENDNDPDSMTATLSGELVLAIDPAHTAATGDPVAHAESLFGRILGQQDGFLPSTSRHCGSQRADLRRRSEEEGVDVPADLLASITSLT